MIKPDAIEARKAGLILAEVERAGFEILDLRLVRLTPRDAPLFYAVHEGKPFLDELVQFMSSGPPIPCRVRGDRPGPAMWGLTAARGPREAVPGTVRPPH